MGMVGLRDVLVVAPASSFHSPHHHHHESLFSTAAAGDHQIIPLLSAAPCLVDDADGAAPGRQKPIAAASGIQFWQSQAPPPNPAPNPNPNLSYLKKPIPSNLDTAGILSGGGIAAGAGGGPSTCQDCGNQAKKDCSHRRCRTCCKSRGFDCSTHVKSTWVPAARRRERQVTSGTASGTAAAGAGAGSSASTSASKKPRLIGAQTATNSHTSTSNTTPPRSFDTSSSQDASFREGLPGHVRAPAVFKCVRVTSIDDGEDEYAYQAMVKIGGHVFKGFLYDQGVDDGHADDALAAAAGDNNNNNNSTCSAIPNLSELHLGGGGGRNGGASSSSAMLPSDVYASGAPTGGGMHGGTNYGNPIN